MRERNYSIDILKFFAALLITNSHMGVLYGSYSFLATGGAIGDVLFFFCSGFTLFMGRADRFDNWYKRRINRIYPSVISWALIGSWFFGLHYDAKFIMLQGGGWFVSCIMIYYVLLYLIRQYWIKYLRLVFFMTCIGIVSWYLFEDRSSFFMYGETYFKWCHYFLFMLLGGVIGISEREWNFSFVKDSCKLIGSIVLFYAMMFLSSKNPFMMEIQIITLIPLGMVTYYFYRFCNTKQIISLLQVPYIGKSISIIGALTLEIYLVQSSLFTDKMNSIFPFNLVVMFAIIVTTAYIVKIVSRIFSQTFNDQSYNWKSVFKI